MARHVGEILFSHLAARERQERTALEAAEREREDRAEKKLLAELELEEQRATAPAEATHELPPAEVALRLERLERQQPLNGGRPAPVPVAELEKQNRRRESLRLLRIRKQAESERVGGLVHDIARLRSTGAPTRRGMWGL